MKGMRDSGVASQNSMDFPMIAIWGTFWSWPLSYLLGDGNGTVPLEPDDNDLVRQFLAGNSRAFDVLVNRFQDRMFNVAYRMVNNHEEARDLTQEIFVRLYKKIGSYRGESAFSTWFHSLAINLCRTQRARLRVRAGREVVSLDDADPDDPERRGKLATARERGPDREAAGQDITSSVEACVAELGLEFREVMVLRDIQGMEYEEIATVLNIALGTVKSRLARARFQVKGALIRKGIVR